MSQYYALSPIMFGLGLCSTYDLSFNVKLLLALSIFIAALATNLTEW